MFPFVRHVLTDAVELQLAYENAYSRAFVKADGSPCSNPGNARYDHDSLFHSFTADGHDDTVFKWSPADSECHLPYDIDFRKELQNKTVLFIGNSLSRGTFWQLASLIDHAGEVVGVDRLMQKKACSKTSSKDVSCHLRPEGVPNMYFSWLQTLDKLADRAPHFIEGMPKKPDIVVYNLGLQHLLFDKAGWVNKQAHYFKPAVEAMRKAWPDARLVYLPITPANENNERVRGHWQLENLAILQWNRDAIELAEELKLDWIPATESVYRGWYQQLGYGEYGYVDHFHPSPHVYSLWARMLLSILRQPARV